MKRLNLLCWPNGMGLSRHVDILHDVLGKAGFAVTHSTPRRLLRAGRRLLSKLGARPYDVNVFLQDVEPSWLPFARVNCLLPHQEWFDPAHVPLLGELDLVLCATREAERTFGALGARTQYTSFTSVDRLLPETSADMRAPLHLAGGSAQKGTRTVIELWRGHPEWPTLLLRQHPLRRQELDVPNIEYSSDYLPDDRLRQEQNQRGLHLCPSEAEAFGHYIVEAMSCGALVITTDASPMNELVTPERGLLAGYADKSPQRFGTNYYVDQDELGRRVEQALGLDTPARRRLGEAARAWFEDNDRYFRRRIVEVMRDL